MKNSGQQSPLSRRKFLKQTSLATGAFFIVPRFVLGGPGYTAPSDRIGLATIGCGRQGVGLGGRFMELPDIQMLAACDIFEAKRERFRQKVNAHYAEANGQTAHNACEIYHDYREILNRDDIDAVIVALPDHWHALASIDALNAGKDLYVEKPMAHTINEGRAMVKAARKNDRVVQTGSMQRSWENFRHACELVRNGYLGEIKEVLVNVGDPAVPYDLPKEALPEGLDWDTWLGPAPVHSYNHVLAPTIPEEIWPKWRDYEEFGGGILADWGAHMFDIAQWALDMDESGPVQLIPPEDPKATRGLKLIYENGIEMRHEDFERGWGVRFIGTEGRLDISRQYLDSDPPALVQKQLGSNDQRLYHSDDHHRDWIDCIKTRERPICDVETGHRSASVCNIANIAYKLGRPLEWDPKREKFRGDRDANRLRGKDYRKPFQVRGA